MDDFVNVYLKAAELWCKFSGTSFDQTQFSGMKQITASISNKRIKKAVELDSEGYLPILIINNEFLNYIDDYRIKLSDVLFNEEKKRQIEISRQLIDIINTDIVKQRFGREKSQTYELVRKIRAYKQIESGHDPVNISEPREITNRNYIDVLYDAKLAAQNLRVDQFSKGNKSNKSPVLSNKIYQCYCVHNFINALASNPEFDSIVAMCLVRDAYDPLFSYFVIGVRNGQRIYLLSDKPKEPHPLYKTRTRRPGRHQEERMCEYWFPYYLLDFEVDGRGDLMGSRNDKRIVEQNFIGAPLSELRILEDSYLIWFILLYQEIVGKFFINNYEKDDLSYTGSMIRIKADNNVISNALMVQGASTLIIDIPSTKELPVLINQKANFRYPLLNNIDLYNNFSCDVPSEALLPIADQLKEVTIEADGIKTTGYSFDINSFGTEQELVQDILFIVRHNEAQLIKAKLNENFEQRKREIREWYEKRIQQNKEALFKAIAEGKLIATDEEYNDSFDYIEKEKNILMFGEKDTIHKYSWFNFTIKGPNGYGLCSYNGAKPHYEGLFCAGTAAAIAKIAGVEISDLPIEIQNYKKHGRYSGNSILQRVDPVECIQNPYNDINFNVDFYLSKSGYKELLKKYKS